MQTQAPQFMLSFQHIFSNKRLDFPCDSKGAVFLETLPEKARNNYFFARATMGKEYLTPKVQQV